MTFNMIVIYFKKLVVVEIVSIDTCGNVVRLVYRDE